MDKKTYISPQATIAQMEALEIMAGSNEVNDNGDNIKINPGTMQPGNQDSFKSSSFGWFDNEDEE